MEKKNKPGRFLCRIGIHKWKTVSSEHLITMGETISVCECGRVQQVIGSLFGDFDSYGWKTENGIKWD